MRKVFDIYINDKPFPVFNIEGKEHNLGKANGCPDTWWLDYTRDEEGNYFPEKTNSLLTEMTGSATERQLLPYIDKGVNRICWEISYKQGHTMKYKWDDCDIRSYGICTMKANGREVYKFRHSDLQAAMREVQNLEEKLISHPYNFFHPENDDGRKIYYKSLPAFVRTGYEVGEIKIEPDYSVLPKEKWWRIYELFNERKYESADSIFRDDALIHNDHLEECKRNDMINWGDALSDRWIDWFRD